MLRLLFSGAATRQDEGSAMHTLRSFLSRFAADASGATAVEYGLILVGLALLIFGALQAIGTNIATMFDKVSAIFQ